MRASNLWRGLATLTAVLLVVMIGAGPIADSHANTLNNWLGTTNYQVVTVSDGETSDGVYFDSEFTTLGDMVKAANDMAVEIADWYLVYTEGIYSGYRYYETRYEDTVLGRGNANSTAGSTTGSAWSYADEMVYPFGYGISYTTFEQKLESVSVELGGEGKATVTVTNTGTVPGKCVVELYVQAPYIEGGLEKVAISLLDFGKTGLLQPGQSETVEIVFDPMYMASYDENAVKANGTQGVWVLDEGDYYFAVGNGAHEALNNILAKKLGTSDGLVTINADEEIHAENAAVWTLGAKDIETYSVNVENALQNMDINKLIPGTAEYTTRADWSKGWQAVSSLTPTAEMMVDLTNQHYSLSANGEGVTWGADNGLKLISFIQVDENGNYAGIAVCTGAARKGLMMEVKHFAFNQQEYDRTGVSTYMTEQTARETELRSFQGPLQSNTAMSIMTSFNRAGAIWAGAHEGLLTQIVRNEWGFTGWITTDMINGANYMNWKDAMSAGSSALLSNLGTYADSQWGTMTANRSLIASDTEFHQKMQQQLKYALYTTVRSNAVNGITSNTELVYVRTWWQNAITAAQYSFGALTVVFVVLAAVSAKKRREQ